MKPIREGLAVIGHDFGQPQIVSAEENRPARLHCELAKFRTDRRQVRKIIEVFFVDVENDRGFRMKLA